MTIDLAKKQVSLSELKMSTSSVVMVDGDVIVPDVKPDIKEILLAEATAVISSKDLAGGKLTVSGNVLIKILYAPETENENSPKMKNMTAKFEFKDSIDCPAGDVSVSVKAVTEHIEFSMINSRKMNMKVAVAVKANAYAKKEISLCAGVPADSGLQTRMRSLNLYNNVADEQKDLIIAENIEVPSAKPEIDEILKMDIHAVKGDCKLMNNKIMLKGVLHIATLYSSVIDGYTLEHMEHEIPFTEVLDIDGLGEECMCNVQYDVKDIFYAVKEDENGEPRIVALEILVGASVAASHTVDAELLDDCYSPTANTRLSKEKIQLDELINEGTSQLSVKEIMSVPEGMPPVNAVYNVSTKPIITESLVQDGKLYVRGNLVVFLLYVSREGDVPMTSLVQEFPFEQVIGIGECGGKVMLGSDVSVLSASFTLNAASEVEIRCNLEFYTKVIRPYEMEIISGCELEEEEEGAERDEAPRLVIYFVQPGDTMWDIAKRYRTTYGKIMSANQIEDAGRITAGQKLLIPRV